MQFTKAEDADIAMAAMDGSIFQGRLLHVLPARKAPAPPEQPEKVFDSVHVAASPMLGPCNQKWVNFVCPVARFSPTSI